MLELGIKEYFDVETARSANEAEIMMATRSYGVVGCDHLMPGEEGLAFLTRARRQFPQVQRILMTGSQSLIDFPQYRIGGPRRLPDEAAQRRRFD